jgi:hypothetical protein
MSADTRVQNSPLLALLRFYVLELPEIHAVVRACAGASALVVLRVLADVHALDVCSVLSLNETNTGEILAAVRDGTLWFFDLGVTASDRHRRPDMSVGAYRSSSARTRDLTTNTATTALEGPPYDFATFPRSRRCLFYL